MPNNANRGRNIIREKKWFIGVISLVLVIGLGVFFALRSNNLGEPVTYVSLSVNPEIEFTVDSRNRVVSVEAINADAEQIVLNEDFIGMDIEDAAQRFTQHCIELGFITTEEEPEGTQNEVRITVVNADEEVENELRNKLQERLQKHFDNNGIFGKVSQETLELYAEDAVLSGRSVGHIKLIMRALEFNPQFTFYELKELPVNEVIALTKEKHDSLRDVSKEMKTLLELELNNLKTSAKYNLVFVELSTTVFIINYNLLLYDRVYRTLEIITFTVW